MLIGIPKIIPPDLLKIMMEMGHGDELVIGDGNFPAASHAQRLVRCDGHGTPELLDAILQLFPLDRYVERPVAVMGVVPGDDVKTPIWDVYREVIQRRAGMELPLAEVERHQFYERAKRAYAIVSTGESALYANVIVKKGVIHN